MDTTVNYYNTNAQQFFDSTVNVDMSELYKHFVPFLPTRARILDVGCGSGRDSKYFIDCGYEVEAMDVTEEFCILASSYIGQPVKHLDILDLTATNEFDAVWACASLLHIKPCNLEKAFTNIKNCLKSNGILYASFKYGDFSGIRNGRYFTDMTETSFQNLLNRVGGFKIVKEYKTGDVREGRHSEMWLNVIIQKI